jgi:hypothetical protein
VVPRAGADATAIAARAGLGLRRAFPALGLAYLDVPEGESLAEALGRVQADAEVVSAEIELVEGPVAPR